MVTSIVLLGLIVTVVILVRRSRLARPAHLTDPRRVLGSVAANLSRGVAAGMTPAASLASAADHFDGPVGDQLRAVRDGLSRGATMDRVLLDWVARVRAAHRPMLGRDRSPDPDDVELLVCAIRFGEPQGAGLVEAFEGVAMALVDRAELDNEVRALTSQAWASVAVLCSLPVVGLVILATISPSAVGTLVGTSMGVVCLVVAALLDTGAVLIARRFVAGALR